MTGQLRAGSKVQHSVQSGLGRDRAAPRTESPPNAFGSKVEKAQRGSHPRLGPLSSPGRLCPRLRGGDAPAQTPALTRDSPPNSWRRSRNPRSQLARAPSPAPRPPAHSPPRPRHVPRRCCPGSLPPAREELGSHSSVRTTPAAGRRGGRRHRRAGVPVRGTWGARSRVSPASGLTRSHLRPDRPLPATPCVARGRCDSPRSEVPAKRDLRPARHGPSPTSFWPTNFYGRAHFGL